MADEKPAEPLTYEQMQQFRIRNVGDLNAAEIVAIWHPRVGFTLASKQGVGRGLDWNGEMRIECYSRMPTA